MFQRRENLSFIRKVREFLWPSMGWVRLFKYYRHRMGRMPGTAYYIAAGIASGVAISFTPFIGFHLIFAILLAKTIRASVLAAILGTLIGNPWTFPFIWWLMYEIGIYVLGYASEVSVHIPRGMDFETMIYNPELFISSVGKFVSLMVVSGLPMLIGGIPLSIAAWVLSYYPIRDLIIRYKTRRMRKLKKAILRDFKKKARQ